MITANSPGVLLFSAVHYSVLCFGLMHLGIAQHSVHELFAGSVAVYFYGGMLVVGQAVPAWLAWTGLSGTLSLGAMAVPAVASAFGDFS